METISLLLFLYGLVLAIIHQFTFIAIEKQKGFSFAVKKQAMISNILAIIYTLSVIIVAFILSL